MELDGHTPRLWLDDGDVRLWHGDVRECLRALPAASVQSVVTSPPYWGLRDYGTARWEGGNASCDHGAERVARRQSERQASVDGGVPGSLRDKPTTTCRCGARRVDGQLGLEATPALFVEGMVAVFREVWRVLRDDGTLWLNLGDSYGSGPGRNDSGEQRPGFHGQANGYGGPRSAVQLKHGLKPKDLVGIPWRVAFALQDDGWYLRSDVVWSKPNPMPESVTDRPTKAHEYVFLFSKRPRYFYDADAVRERATYYGPNGSPVTMDGAANARPGEMRGRAGVKPDVIPGRNLRSVWEIATQPYPGAHFATYPQALVERCVKAGTSERGECAACGAPWRRVTERESPPGRDTRTPGVHTPTGNGKMSGAKMQAWLDAHPPVTTGWRPSCQCDAPTRPQTVLDPFMGSGTTAYVARRLGRHAVGAELNEAYLQLAADRLAQQSLLGGVA